MFGAESMKKPNQTKSSRVILEKTKQRILAMGSSHSRYFVWT